MRWRRLVATPVGTALALSSITALATAAVAASASPARPDSVAASGNGSEQPATAPAPPQPPGPLPSVDELEAQMLSMVNAERAAAGAGSVQQVGWAHSVARQHAQDMAAAGDIWHNIAGFINQGHSALRATYLGENVAMDSTLTADDALLYSDIPHRNVTLDRRFNTVGLGIALDSRNWVYVTEDFAQIPGWAAPQAAGAASAHAAAVPAPVARAPVAKAAVAKASVVTTNRPQAVAVAPPPPAPAPVPAAAAVAVPPAAAVPVVAAPAAEPITTNPVSHASAHPGAKARSRSGPNSGGVWILLGLGGALIAAFGGHRFRTMLARGRTQPPVATAPGPRGSPSSTPSWRQAA
jgi:uncharacterized protein YkwD